MTAKMVVIVLLFMDGSISIVADYIDQMVCGRGQTLKSVPCHATT